MTKHFKKHIPITFTSVEHMLISEARPSQPRFPSSPLTHLRDLNRLPPPHDTEHCPQLFQLV